MDELISRKDVFHEINEWKTSGEHRIEMGMRFLIQRIKRIPVNELFDDIKAEVYAARDQGAFNQAEYYGVTYTLAVVEKHLKGDVK